MIYPDMDSVVNMDLMADIRSIAALGGNSYDILLDVVGMSDPRKSGPLCVEVYIGDTLW